MSYFDRYRTFVFDCDGVLLNSNEIKTNAFYRAALPYGKDAARSLVRYHTENGGISRYKKFSYFLDNLAPNTENAPTLEDMLNSYADLVKQDLVGCEAAQHLDFLRKRFATKRWLVVSGSDQEELRDVFKTRGLTSLFDGGIFGSPTPKESILTREIAKGNIELPSCFFGDSRYDMASANAAGLDFIFVRGWSEWKDWRTYKNNFSVVLKDLSDLLEEEPFSEP